MLPPPPVLLPTPLPPAAPLLPVSPLLLAPPLEGATGVAETSFDGPLTPVAVSALTTK